MTHHGIHPTKCAAVLRIPATLMVVPNASAQAPVITNANDGSGSAAFWYLNGNPSVDGYYVQQALNLQPPNDGNPAPTIVWSTDQPLVVSISPAPNGLSALLTAEGSSDTTPKGVETYNIHITVTYDGTPS